MPPRRSARIAERDVARAARLVAQNKYGQQTQQSGQGQQNQQNHPGPRQPKAGQQLSPQSQQRQAVRNLEPHPSFLGLSRELRRRIYQFVLNFEGWIVNTAIPVPPPPVANWVRRYKHKKWVSNGLSLLAVNRAINEEIWDDFIGPWGWLDMHTTAIKVPLIGTLYEGEAQYGQVELTKELQEFLPLAVRDSASTVILHMSNAADVLYDRRPEVDWYDVVLPDVTVLFPTACKPAGRFVVWFDRWHSFASELKWPLEEIFDMILAVRSLRVGESFSFAWNMRWWLDWEDGYWYDVITRSIETEHFNLTFEYPMGQKTMQQIIFNDPPDVVTIKTIWRKDSYGGRWYSGRK